jgi:hypothetical protein
MSGKRGREEELDEDRDFASKFPDLPVLPRSIPEEMRGFLTTLVLRLTGMESEIAVREDAAQTPRPAPFHPVRAGERIWRCPACARQLGYYSLDTGILRFKFRSQIAWSYLAPGSWFTVPCFSCCEMARIERSDAGEIATVTFFSGVRNAGRPVRSGS